MRNRLLATCAALMLSACGDVASTPTPAATPDKNGCGGSAHVSKTSTALVLPPANVPAGLHEVSAAPVDLGTGASVPKDSHQVVYADNGNTRRLVTQAVVTSDMHAAAGLFEGTHSAISKSGGTVLGAPPLCDAAQLASVTLNGKRAFILTWHHANVFAEIVEYHDLATDAELTSDVTLLAQQQDALISKALTH